MARMPASGVRRSCDIHAMSSRRLRSCASILSRASASRRLAALSSRASCANSVLVGRPGSTAASSPMDAA